MTETQAKSGAAGAPAKPVEQEAPEATPPATGRAAVGRATVPADSPSPKFTRAPGMSPPPDRPTAGTDGEPPAPAAPAAVSAPPAASTTATAPVMTPAPGNIPPGTPIPVVRSNPTAVPMGHPGAPMATAAIPTATAPAGPATGRVGVAGGMPGTAAPARGSAVPGAARAGAAAVGAARVTEAVRLARSTVAGAAARGPRRARLHVKRIDPWSVMKFSFAVSLVLFIVVIVATAVLYLALDAMGVFESINSSLTDLVSAGGGTASDFKITAKGVIGTSALLGAVNVVLFTALMTLGAFIYNVCADLVGGVELTLAERD